MGKVKGQMEYEKWRNDEKLTLKGAILGHCL